MPQINSGKSPPWVSGEIVTAAGLNGMIDSATLDPSAITAKTNLTTLTGDEYALVVDTSGALKKTQLKKITEAGVVTDSITGFTAGTPLTIKPSGTTGELELFGGSSGGVGQQSGDIRLYAEDVGIWGQQLGGGGGGTIGFTAGNGGILFTSAGGVVFNSYVSFTTTDSIKIPAGTTAQRPVVPSTGDIRYNTTLGQAEVYSGSIWKAVGGSPFDASGGVTTTIDGYKIHTFTVSSFFTPSLTKEGKVEVLVVGAGGAGSGMAGGGGGGGGDVKAGFVDIALGTAPMTVTVGVGVSGTGTSSSFGGITANGGGAGSGSTGGTSGSGIAGGAGGGNEGGGGAGAQTTEIFNGSFAGGVGGQGFGSSISGTLTTYGGGGGGGGQNSGVFPTTNRIGGAGNNGGGGGNGGASVANSGGGGGGAGNAYAAGLGADGIVIIRYRVS